MPPLTLHASNDICVPKIMLNTVLKPNCFNVCYANVQSICANNFQKFEELKEILVGSRVEVACFAESWLRTAIPDSAIDIPGFKFVRNDRVYAFGGGVIVYYRSHLTCKLVYESTAVGTPHSGSVECLLLEFATDCDTILVGVVYNPPGMDCSLYLDQKLSEFSSKYDNIILVGDFNTDLKKEAARTKRLVEVFDTFCLTSMGTEPTHFFTSGCTLLDLFLVCNRDKMLSFSQIDVPGLSNHDMLFGSYDIAITRNEQPTSSFRDYNRVNANLLAESINAIPWAHFEELRDPDDCLAFLNQHLHQVRDKCFPLRTVSGTRRHNPWFNDEIRKSMIERDLAYNDWKHADQANKLTKHNTFKTLRNRTNQLIRDARSRYFSRDAGNTKLFWRKLRTAGVGKCRTDLSEDLSPNDINDYFAGCCTRSSTPTNVTADPIRHHADFVFRQVDVVEVVNSLFSISSNATGFDDLPICFWKRIFPLVANEITFFFNLIFETSQFPSAWKKAKVIPLKKKPHLSGLTNLRPISLLSALSKAFEKLMKSQISSYLDDLKLLSEYQSGFRSKRSTKTALLKVCDDIMRGIDRKGIAVLLLLDFTKAFDSISHSRLLKKLRDKFGFGSSAVNLVHSYLTGRTQAVFFNGLVSEEVLITSGVPQGSVVGPLLFSMYINDLPSVLRHCLVHMFADDVQLYCFDPNVSTDEIIHRINEDVCRIVEWCNRNTLFINPVKSQAIVMKLGRAFNATVPPIIINGEQIEFVCYVNDLGVVLQENFVWDKMASSVCSKVYACLRSLRVCTAQFSVATKLLLFKSLILPHFLYADVVYMNLSAAASNRLRVALNCCVRYIYNLGSRAHVSHLQPNLIGCRFEHFYKLRCCLTLFKVIYGRDPNYLYEKLTPFQGRRSGNFILPLNRSAAYGNSFFVRGIVHWNSLPTVLKFERCEATFKKGCLEYFNSL